MLSETKRITATVSQYDEITFNIPLCMFYIILAIVQDILKKDRC